MADELINAEREGTNIGRMERLVELQLLILRAEKQKESNRLLIKNKVLLDDLNAELNEQIKHYKEQIGLQKAYVQIGDKTLEQLEEKNKENKKSLEITNNLIKGIKTSNSSFSKMIKDFKDVRKTAESAGLSFKSIRENATFGSLFKNLKNFDFQGFKTAFATSGGFEGVVKNTFPALETLGTRAALAGGALAGIAVAGKMFWDNILVPSARMRNVAGQQLGLAAGSRNLFGGAFLREWAGRTLLGYSADEQKGLYSSLVDALRINPNEIGASAKYQNALTGMMAVQRIWGTDTGTLNKFYKAYSQTGTATGQLSERFNKLMRSVEGTGWTTSEYADTLGKNIMYLKNFGINLDTYSKDLLKYGQAIREEKLTTEEIGPKMRGEGPGELAFVAQQLLKSGIISEKELGAGLGDNIFKQSGALRKLSLNQQRFRQLLFKLYTTDPRYKSMLQNAGVWGDKVAMWEFMTRINAPGMSALQEIGYKGPNTFFNVAQGNIGSTPSTGLGEDATQTELVSDAMKNLAQQTTGFKGLLIAIADMITRFSNTLQVDESPKGFNQ